jgi:hypothetical protein
MSSNKKFSPFPFIPSGNLIANTAGQFINRYKTALPNVPDYINNTSYGEYGAFEGLPMGQLNTPVQSWIRFIKGSYSPISPQFKIPVEIEDLLITNCLIKVTQAKNIVKTRVAGRNGTIKTYMGMDDYEITIDGYIVPEKPTQSRYPVDLVKTLVKICNSPVSIMINCPYLQLFDINYLIIKDFNFEQTEGGYSQQRFTITCLSDQTDIGNVDIKISQYDSYVTK